MRWIAVILCSLLALLPCPGTLSCIILTHQLSITSTQSHTPCLKISSFCSSLRVRNRNTAHFYHGSQKLFRWPTIYYPPAPLFVLRTTWEQKIHSYLIPQQIIVSCRYIIVPRHRNYNTYSVIVAVELKLTIFNPILWQILFLIILRILKHCWWMDQTTRD